MQISSRAVMFWDFQLPPKIFYGVEIWRLARPLQDLEMLLTKPRSLRSFGAFVRRCLTLRCRTKRPASVHASRWRWMSFPPNARDNNRGIFYRNSLHPYESLCHSLQPKTDPPVSRGFESGQSLISLEAFLLQYHVIMSPLVSIKTQFTLFLPSSCCQAL